MPDKPAAPPRKPPTLALPRCFLCGAETICSHREPELLAWYAERYAA